MSFSFMSMKSLESSTKVCLRCLCVIVVLVLQKVCNRVEQSASNYMLHN